MTHTSRLVSAVLLSLAPTLPLPGEAGDKGKEDPVIAGMKFVKVPKGTFWMGWDSQEKKSKQVEIKQDFELAAYPVTQEQWEAVMGTNPSYFSRKGKGVDNVKNVSDADLKRFPVEQVSWEDAQEFLKKLNARAKGKGWVYRLPTQAEWEYACRGTATSKKDCSFDYYLDRPTNNLSSKQANFRGTDPGGKAERGPYLGRTSKVGSYPPNKLGLYDMHGNVQQWCGDKYLGTSSPAYRGGSWIVPGMDCTAAYMRGALPTLRVNYIGLRLVRVPSGTGK